MASSAGAARRAAPDAVEASGAGPEVEPRRPPLAPADMNAWVAQAEDVHPSIRQARLGFDVASLEVEKAQAGHKPTLDAPRHRTGGTGKMPEL